ncbi:MAG TPA: alpha/beta hydrolase [Acidimicrobiales bacterium]|nr:alpha/beta hydrolase [Acidimicrobiales bacterium]
MTPATGMAPLIPIPQVFEVTVEDVEYQRPGGVPLLARLYRPVGAEAVAAVLDVHGGAWVVGDRTQQQALDQAIASSGVLVAAVDFRQPPGNPYPTSIVDVNLATRWLKRHAVDFGVAAGAKTGAFGGSSGGHVVILSAMRPRDPRYSASPLPEGEGVDASLDFVVVDAPVTDPYARYLTALEEGRADIVERHRLYWLSDEAAVEGNPNRILERGERVELPPLFVSQGTDDRNVPLPGTREFVERYARAGGEVQLMTFDGLQHGFILEDPSRAESVRQAESVLAFIHDHAGQRR